MVGGLQFGRDSQPFVVRIEVVGILVGHSIDICVLGSQERNATEGVPYNFLRVLIPDGLDSKNSFITSAGTGR